MKEKLNIFVFMLWLSLFLIGCGAGGGQSATGNSQSGGGGLSRSLSWSPPITRVDGTMVDPSEIKGYKILYGIESGVYSNTEDVGNVTSHVFDDLDDDATYFAVVVAYDNDMVMGDYSDEVSF